MNNKGWVCITRKYHEHPVFAAEPFTEREAFQWLICKAAWKDTKHRIGTTIHDVPRGSLFCTLRQMAREWRWKSDYRVRSFLKTLEIERMVFLNPTQGKTHITICNYNEYQNTERKEKRTDNAESNASATHRQRTKETNKQINNNTTLLGGRVSELYEALGITDETMSPGLLSLSDPLHWIESGCDLDKDVLPTLRTIAARGKSITSFAYCSKAVFEARDMRLAPAPEVNQKISGKNRKQSSIVEKAFRRAANG